MLHIVFHAHRADVTEPLQQRAEQSVRKLASRLRGSTDASIRFCEDGAVRRVDVVLKVARRAPMHATGEGTRYEVALSSAVERLAAHVAHLRAERARRRRTTVDIGDAARRDVALGDAARDDAARDDVTLDDVTLDAATPPRPAAEA